MRYRISALLLLIATSAHAQIYVCNEGGHKAFSEQPCGADAKPVTLSDGEDSAAPEASNSPLGKARRGYKTGFVVPASGKAAASEPPAEIFRKVRYPAPVGKLGAYLTPDPHDGARHPAIIWITGGDCNSIDDVWSPASPSNDQTAAAYRKAGIVMMFPSLRGGNDNPGKREGFYGEVDDVLAAANYLARQDYVDPQRIYLGGHSTGGTLALLTAEVSSRFRAVFAFGPVSDVRGYGNGISPFQFDALSGKEAELRAPGRWLDSIQSPVFVLEGEQSPGNISELNLMRRGATNTWIHWLPIRGANHFSSLAKANAVIARKILADTGPSAHITLRQDELSVR